MFFGGRNRDVDLKARDSIGLSKRNVWNQPSNNALKVAIDNSPMLAWC